MGHTHHRSIMKAIAIFLSLVQASSLKRQDGNGYAATFPEQWTNVTGASQFSGSFDFLGVEGGVQVSASADNFPSGSLAKRQSLGQVNYAIYSGPATTGCRSVGSIIPGGDLSQQFGPLTEGAAVSYIAPDINADPNGGANSIAVGQRSVVASLLDGTIFACANIVVFSTPQYGNQCQYQYQYRCYDRGMSYMPAIDYGCVQGNLYSSPNSLLFVWKLVLLQYSGMV